MPSTSAGSCSPPAGLIFTSEAVRRCAVTSKRPRTATVWPSASLGFGVPSALKNVVWASVTTEIVLPSRVSVKVKAGEAPESWDRTPLYFSRSCRLGSSRPALAPSFTTGITLPPLTVKLARSKSTTRSSWPDPRERGAVSGKDKTACPWPSCATASSTGVAWPLEAPAGNRSTLLSMVTLMPVAVLASILPAPRRANRCPAASRSVLRSIVLPWTSSKTVCAVPLLDSTSTRWMVTHTWS